METSTSQTEQLVQASLIIPADAFLEYWQGHRRVTRRMIEAFPEEHFFTFSIGGMRPFSALVMEMIGMAAPGIRGAVTGEWLPVEELPHHAMMQSAKTRAEMLALWDEVTEDINTFWPQISSHRFTENDVAFGQYAGTVYSFIQYFIDNEIHHRGQGYVYLRALGIEPPAFWDRS